MRLSILLRTRNCAKELSCFADRAELGDEIIVVDHGSVDSTLQVAMRLGAKLIPYDGERFSYGAAINTGVKYCSSDWVLVMSPHCHPIRASFWDTFISELERLDSSTAACQATVRLTVNGAPDCGITFYDSSDLGKFPWPLYGNTCCAYRREALEKLPFDEKLPTAEDLDWGVRAVEAGLRICVNHRTAVLYRSRAPYTRYWRRGRTDPPTVARIYRVDFRPSFGRPVVDLGKEFILWWRGELPSWMWRRMVVKRIAEFSLWMWGPHERESKL